MIMEVSQRGKGTPVYVAKGVGISVLRAVSEAVCSMNRTVTSYNQVWSLKLLSGSHPLEYSRVGA